VPVLCDDSNECTTDSCDAAVDGLPSGSSKCVYHNWNWSGWSCAWKERVDDVRMCPCQ
jgi:hypothetical protein